MDDSQISLIDIRYPLLAVAKFNNHKDSANGLAWAPSTGKHLCTISDDNFSYIWDI